MYIIIFEDGSIRLIEDIDESCLDAFEDNMIDLIDPDNLKMLSEIVGDELVWVDIERV